MANKNKKASKRKDTGLMAQAKVVNQVALEVGGELVDLTLKGAKTTQRIVGKIINGGVTIFGMQQDMALDTLEKVVSNEQVKNLVQLPAEYVKEMTQTVRETVAVARDESKKAVKKAVKKAEDLAEEVADKVEIVAAGEVVKTEEVKPNVSRRVVVVKRGDDLTKIKGIGPKAAELLNTAGFSSFNKLAKASDKDLRKALEAGGARYARLNSETWNEQAAFAAKGDWKALDAWNSTYNA